MADNLNSDFPKTGWRRSTSVEVTVKQEAGLVIEAWTVTSDDGRRWLVTCGKGVRGEPYVNATLRRGADRRYLPQDVSTRILERARMCAG